MKRYCFGIFLSILVVLTVWAQAADAPFDMEKTQKELEIMRGIFKTTLSFNSDDTQKSDFFNFADIRFMYLANQGVNFFMQNMYFIPPVEIPLPFDDSFQSSLEMMEENLERVQENLKQKEMAVGEYYSARKSMEEKAKEAAEAQREQLLEKQKEMEQRLQAQKEKTMKRQEDRRKKLPEIKESLIEAVANYGDSLTTVKPEEYINLVFEADGQYDIVSIQKFWIKDYKAGVLTLDQFKAKVIQYSMKGR